MTRRRWLTTAAVVSSFLFALFVSCSAATPAIDGRDVLGGFPRLDVDGSAGYYARFPQAVAAGWSAPSFFPTGVWLESVKSTADISKDRQAGINTYFNLTADSDSSLLRGTGMTLVGSPTTGLASGAVAGWYLADEMDMKAGPGDAPWIGDPNSAGSQCAGIDQRCGYTAMKQIASTVPQDDGRFRWANYGKGVMLWQTDEQAERFVNGPTDVISADVYWYSDPAACISAGESLGLPPDQCRRALNYGRMIDRMRGFEHAGGRQQPIFAFVELGSLSSSSQPIRPEEVQGAVMSSVIHGARGIIYFGHSFAGQCVSAHLLRDSCATGTAGAVRAVNAQLHDLAPALNSPSIKAGFGPDVDATLREVGADYYLIAMASSAGTQTVRSINLPAPLWGAKVTAPYENNRPIAVDSTGQIVDQFPSECSYHIYKLTP